MFKRTEVYGHKECVNAIYSELKYHDPASEEYAKIVARLSELNDIAVSKRMRVSPDVLVASAANLLAVVIVVKHEQMAVITSKAFQIVRLFK